MTVAQQDPLGIHDIAQSPLANQSVCFIAGVQAYLGTPIVVNGKRFGAVSFAGMKARPTAFSATDKDLVSLIGNWVSVALERKAAQAELQTAKETAEQASRTKSAFLAKAVS